MKTLDINNLSEITGGDFDGCGLLGVAVGGIAGFISANPWFGIGAGLGSWYYCNYIA